MLATVHSLRTLLCSGRTVIPDVTLALFSYPKNIKKKNLSTNTFLG